MQWEFNYLNENIIFFGRKKQKHSYFVIELNNFLITDQNNIFQIKSISSNGLNSFMRSR